MKKTILAVCTFLTTACCLTGYAQDDAAMKAMQAYMTPGEVHKMLAKFDGKWKSENTMWMMPGAPPMKMESDVENKMILGGRYQQSTHKGSFNGMPFEGVSTLGWDNAKKVLVTTWMDNMGTGIMFMEGSWDANNNMMNMKGKQTDPMTGKEMDIRETFKIVDDNTQIMEMFGPGPDGKEYKMMEVKFTRKK
jgi:hypothetical protein